MAEPMITVCTICGHAGPEVCPNCAMLEVTPAQAMAPELHAALVGLVEAIDTYREHKFDAVYRIGQAMKVARAVLKRAGPIEREAKRRAKFYGPEDLSDFPAV